MASSFLFGCGRDAAFKILKLQAWSLRSLPSTVSVCTKPGDSEKGSTKNTGENVISSIPEETVKLTDDGLKKFWANKTLVTFPQRGYFPSFETEPGFSSTGGSNEKPDEESSSSSSSESDSSSDEEDNIIKDTLKTKVAFPSRDPILSEERKVKENITSEQQFPQSQKEDSAPEKHLYSPMITELPFKEKGIVFPRQDPISSEDRTVKVNTSKQQFPTPENNQAPGYSPRITEPLIKEKGVCQTADDKFLQSELVKQATKQTSKETPLKGTDLGVNPAESQRPTANQLEIAVHEAAPSKLSKTQQQSMMTQSLTLLRQEESAARGAQDAESQERGTTEVQEELLNDAAPVVETTMKEEITLETGLQDEEHIIEQEAKAAVETAQEAIDISTYKNLEHHEYTPFTFVNYDVELSKFRLPQPSSGRVSPRH
ncbi:PREDICTED: NADH dehydrogenase [ubiquinone] flavoprotein 3, mitochondrial [Gekko japonicus]|uniref:NADH dehydrogenase [ubiquinone] flavoprotein 3, mitochondrial n=1 Tax=Gekko japonicus TaxID=146911 RepID=A0ABM1JUZ0_GEKJA|nr:PREDICTED: NADH dehydrogenase [ubiquinone] flavoprotein 3, mitochondrial [Gekko japonicus]